MHRDNESNLQIIPDCRCKLFKRDSPIVAAQVARRPEGIREVLLRRTVAVSFPGVTGATVLSLRATPCIHWWTPGGILSASLPWIPLLFVRCRGRVDLRTTNRRVRWDRAILRSCFCKSDRAIGRRLLFARSRLSEWSGAMIAHLDIPVASGSLLEAEPR